MSTPLELTVTVFSCSLSVDSLSRRLAQEVEVVLRGLGVGTTLIDLREWDLPLCDGGSSYSHGSVKPLSELIANSSAVLLTSPVYNYDLNAATKNLVEMTGSAWNDKPVGFLCSAGGCNSYMSPIGLANSLMFDFRSLIIPRFVYATKDDFTADGQLTETVHARVKELAHATVDLARALNSLKSEKKIT